MEFPKKFQEEREFFNVGIREDRNVGENRLRESGILCDCRGRRERGGSLGVDVLPKRVTDAESISDERFFGEFGLREDEMNARVERRELRVKRFQRVPLDLRDVELFDVFACDAARVFLAVQVEYFPEECILNEIDLNRLVERVQERHEILFERVQQANHDAHSLQLRFVEFAEEFLHPHRNGVRHVFKEVRVRGHE